MNVTILHFDSLSSTNSEAINQARRGAKEGICIVARQQTAGRGRLGRVWVSPTDAGLYLSIILRPKIELRFLPLLTLTGAIAVFDTLQELFHLKPDIKWANDVHINGKKISGILAETTETTNGLAVIVGIGLNLKSENFPPDLFEIATSIEAETGNSPNPEKTLQFLLKKFGHFYLQFNSENGVEKIRNEWIKRSSYAFDKDVRVQLENETVTGTTRGIEENGALRIETETGEIKIIQAGDVETLRQLG